MEQKEQRNRKYVIYIQKCACPQRCVIVQLNISRGQCVLKLILFVILNYPMTPKSRSVQFSSYRVILALIYRKTICSHYQYFHGFLFFRTNPFSEKSFFCFYRKKDLLFLGWKAANEHHNMLIRIIALFSSWEFMMDDK